MPGSSSEFEDSDVSDELDISQHNNDDLYIPASDMVEVHKASSSDDDSDDNVPLSELAEAEEAICSSSKKLTKAQEHAKKYQWKKSNVTAPESTFEGNFSDPPDEVYSPLTYFKHFIDDDCIRHCTEQTNIYAMQKDGKECAISTDEMERFFGILLYMGLFACPSYRMYWENNSRITCAILRYLHFNDNNEMSARDYPNYDPLFKIRPLLSSLRTNMMKTEPEERHSIDEQIIPFKGRSHMKQYNKNKPHKRGFKVFTRAGVSGMMYDIEIYTGKNMKLEGDLGISGNIVLRLTKDLQSNKDHKVYFDNWFSSVELVKTLKGRGIRAVGTIRKNRLAGCKLALDKKLKESGRGSYDWKTSKDGISIIKWYDNKPVHLISSHSAVEPLGSCKRWSATEKQKVDVVRPYVVEEYNTHMGGVDAADMLMELYRIDLRSKKWYMQIVLYCISVAVVNAWMLYRRHAAQLNTNPKSIVPLKDFQTQIAYALAMKGKQKETKRGRPSNSPQPTKKPRKPVGPTPTDDVRHDNFAHWPIPMEKKMRCKKCIHHFSRMKCSKCDVALCLNNNNNCFLDYHTK